MRKKQLYIDEIIGKIDNVNIFSDKEFAKPRAWQKFFNENNPLILEIGMGDGAFLKQLIAYNEEQEKSFNYIGFEQKPDRVYKALRKNVSSVEAGVLKFIIGKAENLNNIFKQSSLEAIHLNFSDPWPKARHESNRLTHLKYLKLYKKALKKNGHLIIKTDNESLYKFTLESLKKSSFKIIHNSHDLHTSDFLIKNFVTEFEAKYLKFNKPIYFIEATNIKLF